MSVAVNVHDSHEAQAFYERWGPDVFVFCRLFLGDKEQAETASSRAFVEFYSQTNKLPESDEVPSRLIGLALRAMTPCGAKLTSIADPYSLEDCVLSLDYQKRAVFILRNVLGMSWLGVATAMSLPVEEVQQAWLQAMLTVRRLLPRDSFER